MVAISRPWYNGSYTMAAKPIKSLELHYTMIQFLIIRGIQNRAAVNVFFWDQKRNAIIVLFSQFKLNKYASRGRRR